MAAQDPSSPQKAPGVNFMWEVWIVWTGVSAYWTTGIREEEPLCCGALPNNVMQQEFSLNKFGA